MNKTNIVELEKRMSDLNKTNVKLEKRMSVIKRNDKLNFDRKNAPYYIRLIRIEFITFIIKHWMYVLCVKGLLQSIASVTVH